MRLDRLPLGVLAGCVLAGGVVLAPGAAAQEASAIEEVVVVGSRRQDRSAADSPVPVDVIGGDDFRNLGDSDMDSLLAVLVPSYNVNQEPISDAATLIRPANLRGLSSDATLVLVNGKRRHRAAVISFLGSGVNDGAQGPDLSVIPAIALKRLEVLRDGASAQYGSDAIAGVMNFVLKDAAEGGSIEARWGRNYEGDGDVAVVAANIGLPLTDAGFINFSGEFKQADPTSRSAQRGDAAGLIAAGNTAVRQPAAQIWGAPEIRGDFKLFANLGIELGNGSEAYAFGNWAERTVEGGFYYRNPHTRGGIFRGPVVDENNMRTDKQWWDSDSPGYCVPGVDADCIPTVKVADLTPDGTGNCPVVRVTDDRSGADAAALAAVAANPNCFAFNERFPGGFTPQFGGDVHDASIAFGVRGDLESGWFYDLSAVVGRSNAQFFIKNTINPQLAHRETDIPVSYRPGAYTETDRVVDFNLAKPLGDSSAPLHLALGVEYRDETFKIENGDPNSYYINDSLAAQGFGIGSNGFPGFKPEDAGESSRSSWAAYVDMEKNLSENFLFGAAARFENYEDFGNTLDGKLTARLQVSDTFALRGAVSTGFRAPTTGQANVRNVTTAFTGGMLADEATLPPTHPIAVQKGGQALDPEESVNVTFGAVFDVGSLSVTLDYYNISVEDRIALTSTQKLTPNDITALLALGQADASSFTGVRFFTNDFDTTTSGVDLVATLPLELFSGTSDVTVVANWNQTEVDSRNPDIISDNRVRQLEGALPETRFSATFNHVQGDWRWLARVRYYGEFYVAQADVASWGYYPEPRWFADFEVARNFEAFTLVGGAQNAFDEYPEENHPGAVSGVGAKYPEGSPYGFNGGFYYLRAIVDFE